MLIFRRPAVPAILVAAVGILLSLHIRSQIAQTEAAEAGLTAETVQANVEQELNLFADVLQSVCALHALSDAVDQAAMNEFIEKGMVHQTAVLGPFGLVQRISPWLRSEAERRDANLPGAYQVVQAGSDGSWIPADQKAVYYPLTWQSRADGLDVPVGFDFSSLGEEARTAIAQLEQTRRPAVVTNPDPLSEPGAPAYWVFAPVIPGRIQFSTPNTGGNVIGFSVALLHPDRLMQKAAASTVSSTGIRMTLTPIPGSPNAQNSIQRTRGGWIYRRTLNVIDTAWTFECTLPDRTTGNRPASALAIGLVITALLASQIWILGSRTQKIEAEVRHRTEDLKKANLQLEETLKERAALEEELHELAARERRKVGRDLHDSLGQKLTGAVFLSRALMNGVAEEQQTQAKTLNDTLKSAVSQVRDMARGLSPVELNDERLETALRQLADEMTDLYAVPCELTACDEPAGLDAKTREQLYLIAREAVNNAAKHAKAQSITIRLEANSRGWKLCIADNGCGLPADATGTEGMGIRIMRYRTGLLGAQFSTSSEMNHGTAIEISST